MESKRYRIARILAVLPALAFLPSVVAEAAKINALEFKNSATASEVLIRGDSQLEYDSQVNEADRQLVLTFKSAALAAGARKQLDTSGFDGNVLQVSPFPVEGDEAKSRIVIQLREAAVPEVTQDGKLIRISVPRAATPAGESVAAAAVETPAADVEAPKDLGNQNLDVFTGSRETKRFSGRPISIQVRDGELSDVLRMIGEASGFNILVGEGVGGKITLSLVEVPWDQALDVILSTKRLGAERRNNILRIATLASLTQEKEEEFRAKQATQKAAPRVTRIFPISFADAPGLKSILESFSRGGGAPAVTDAKGAAVAGASSATATVEIDQRTNALIIQDTAEGMERMAKLIQLLDTETPQVLIESKIVEATENFTKSLSGSLGFSRIDGDSRGVFGSFFGAATTTGVTGAASTASPPSSTFGYSPSLAFLPNLNRLNAILSVSESSDDTRVIAQPKTVVLNKKAASIVQSSPIALDVITTTPSGPVTSTQVLQANLSLNVTPTVTNSGSVLLQLNISRDTIENNLIAPRNLKTEVLVDSGATLVIGGIYSSTKTKKNNGFPFLKDLPIIGALFGEKSTTDKKQELLIFVTPRIVNEKAAGLATSGSGAAGGSAPSG